MRIGIHESDATPVARELAGQFDRHARASGCARCAPHRDDAPPRTLGDVRGSTDRCEQVARRDVVFVSRHAEHGCGAAGGGTVAQGSDAHAEPIADGDEIGGQRIPSAVDDEHVGAGKGSEHFGCLATRERIDGRGSGGRPVDDRRDHCPGIPQQIGELKAVGTAQRDDDRRPGVPGGPGVDTHRPAAAVGTIDRLDPPAIAARVSGTSERPITTSTAGPADPIIDWSLVTETTVAVGTRMRGVSNVPRSSCGATQISTVEPAVTAAGISVALCTTTRVVRRPSAAPTAS